MVVIASVDVVDDHLTIAMTFPVFPVAVAGVLDSHQSRGTTLDDHATLEVRIWVEPSV